MMMIRDEEDDDDKGDIFSGNIVFKLFIPVITIAISSFIIIIIIIIIIITTDRSSVCIWVVMHAPVIIALMVII